MVRWSSASWPPIPTWTVSRRGRSRSTGWRPLAARSHPLCGRQQIGFADLLDQLFVGLASGSLHDHLAQQAARLGRRIAYRVRLRSFDAVARLVEAGIGIGVLPLAAIERYGSAELVLISLTDDWAHRRLMVCARRFVGLSAHAQRLAEEIERQSLDEQSRPAGAT